MSEVNTSQASTAVQVGERRRLDCRKHPRYPCSGGGAEVRQQGVDSRIWARLTDISLGGANGLEGLNILRQIRQTSPVTRTVVLTGAGCADMEKRALDQRVDAFLRKPVGMREIGAVAAQLLGVAPLIA